MTRFHTPHPFAAPQGSPLLGLVIGFGAVAIAVVMLSAGKKRELVRLAERVLPYIRVILIDRGVFHLALAVRSNRLAWVTRFAVVELGLDTDHLGPLIDLVLGEKWLQADQPRAFLRSAARRHYSRERRDRRGWLVIVPDVEEIAAVAASGEPQDPAFRQLFAKLDLEEELRTRFDRTEAEVIALRVCGFTEDEIVEWLQLDKRELDTISRRLRRRGVRLGSRRAPRALRG